jgi:hypothetical protein
METNYQENTTNTGEVLGWLGKVLKMIKEVGIQNIFLGLIVIFVISFFIFPENYFKKFEKIQQQVHTESVMKRINAEPKIREALVSLRSDTDADRVFLLETHNGGSNLAGLPFLYVDVSYTEPRASLSWLETEYKNVRLSRYPFASVVFNETYWFGSISEIEEIDPELYIRLQKEDVKYLGMMLMYGTYNPSGVLGVVYCGDDEPSPATVKKSMFKYSSVVAQLLNNE